MRSSRFASSCALAVLFAVGVAPTAFADTTSGTPTSSPSATATETTPTPSPTPSESATPSATLPTVSAPTPAATPPTATPTPTPTPTTPAAADFIRQHWQDMGGENDVLGAATSGLVPLRDGAFIQFYRGGQIYWTSQYGAHASRGGIHGTYGAYKWENGPLGFPTSDEVNRTISGIPAQCRPTKTVERYQSAEAEGRALGWPLNDEMKDAARGGAYQHFTGGSIYFHPSTGAHRVTGGIRNMWEVQGWERGQMGYPTGEETATANGGV